MKFSTVYFTILGILSITLLPACTTFNEENYTQCLPLIEVDRKMARAQRDYSYDPENFNACRAPARYRNELEDDEY